METSSDKTQSLELPYINSDNERFEKDRDLKSNFNLLEINFNKTGTPRLTKLKNQKRETDIQKNKKERKGQRENSYVYVMS